MEKEGGERKGLAEKRGGINSLPFLVKEHGEGEEKRSNSGKKRGFCDHYFPGGGGGGKRKKMWEEKGSRRSSPRTAKISPFREEEEKSRSKISRRKKRENGTVYFYYVRGLSFRLGKGKKTEFPQKEKVNGIPSWGFLLMRGENQTLSITRMLQEGVYPYFFQPLP